MPQPVLSCRSLRCRAGDREVVEDLSLDVMPGERVALVGVALLGPSGAGKSTLLWLLAGLLRPSAGRLWLGGAEVGALGPRALDRLRAAQIGVVLQNPARNLVPHASAAQNVAFAQRAVRRRDRRTADDLLGRVGLGPVRDRQAGLLSGGEQQRFAVALANRPRLLLADEPTSQLDAASGRGRADQGDGADVRGGDPRPARQRGHGPYGHDQGRPDRRGGQRRRGLRGDRP